MSAQDVCSLDRWNGLCGRLGLLKDTNIYADLIEAHSQTHRAYHTLEHIAACLKHLDQVKDMVDRPDEIELALWFHDAIYQPFSATNEEDSADWAVNLLSERRASSDLMDRVRDDIYANTYFREQFEDQARINLERAISRL